jgi:predicted PurR-regulated permease PerM
MNASSQRRSWLWAVGAVAAVVVCVWAAPGVCSLLLASFILAYACAPAVEGLARRMPRTVATAIVLLGLGVLIAGVLLLLVPVLVAQWKRLAERLPQALAWVQQSMIPWIEMRTGVEIPERGADIALQLQEHLSTIGSRIAAPLGQLAAKTFGGVIGAAAAIANALLVPVLAFYLSSRWHGIWPRVESLVPLRHVARVRALKDEIDVSLAGFVRGQLTVSAIIGALQAIGLSIVGIDGALVIGLLGGVLNLVPYLGVAIGLTLALLMAALEFGGWGPIIGVLIVFAIVQVLEGMVITPRIVGDKVGLPPVLVIIAILAGGEIFGFVGLLLAIPGAAVLRVLLREARAAYRMSATYTGPAAVAAVSPAAPPPAPPAPSAGPGSATD